MSDFKEIGDLAIYTCAAMVAAKLTKDDIRRAARNSLAGKTPDEPSDIDALVEDIGMRGFHVGPDDMVWGVNDERVHPAKDYVLVRIGRAFD